MVRAMRFLTVCLLGLAWPVLAVAEVPRPPQWYEITTGILAIPVTLIGLAYSYLLIKKTRLESRKTELEIVEKEQILRDAIRPGVSPPVLELQTNENKLLLLLIVRFVVFYLVIQSYELVEDALGFLATGVFIGVQTTELGMDASDADAWAKLNMWATIAGAILGNVPKILYWVIFFALGWPLFKDTNAALGLDVRNYLRVSHYRKSGMRDDANS